MKLLKFIGLFLIIFFFFKPEITHANINISQDPSLVYTSTPEIKFTFTSDQGDFDPNQDYTFNISIPNPGIGVSNSNSFIKPQNNGLIEAVARPIHFGGWETGEWKYTLCLGRSFLIDVCNDSTRVARGKFTVFKTNDLPAIAIDHYKFMANSTQPVYILNAQPNVEYRFWYEGENTIFTRPLFTGKFSQNQIGSSAYNSKTAIASINFGPPSSSPKTLCMTFNEFFWGANAEGLTCDYKLSGIIVTAANPGDPGGSKISNETGTPKLVAPTIEEKFAIPPPPCDINAQNCPTALGNISTNPANFVKTIFGILLSFAGGIAIILIMISGYRLMFSQGNPEKVQAAREQLTSAIVGLLFIIFSITILQVIGVDILKIPGLSR